MTDPHDYFDLFDADYQSLQNELTEEAAEYNLGAAHSNDDGWFYNDDDDGELPNSDLY